MSTSASIKIDAFCPVGIGGTKGIDTTHLKLFVGGLSAHNTSKDLYDIFSAFGTIRESVVIPDRFRVRSRCYGFVTFVAHASVSAVFQKAPITAPNGNKLTVVLASANTKPRRAHFNVKHGVSGHKPLPVVKEEEDDQCEEMNCSMAVRTEIHSERKREGKQPKNKYHKKQVNDKSKIGIYTDPSLFRTANIQPIAPASFHVPSKAIKKEASPEIGTWPNDDIKKDFYHLNKVVVSQSDRDKHDRKSWKLIAMEKEYDNQSYYSMENQSRNGDYDDDDIYSVNSRKWTPLSGKRMVGGDRDQFHPHHRAEQHGDSKWNRLRQQKKQHTMSSKAKSCGPSKGRWVRSPKKSTERAASSASTPSSRGAAGLTTINLTGSASGAEKERKGEREEEEEDRWTFASLFDGSYQNLLMDEDAATNSSRHKNEAVEIEQLRDIFKNRMDDKILKQNGYVPVFNQNVNGMWSPYQPMFVSACSNHGGSVPNTLPSPMATLPITCIAVGASHNGSNGGMYCHSESGSNSFANQVTSYGSTQPQVGYPSMTANANVNMNGTAAMYNGAFLNYDQTNMVYHPNQCYDSNPNLLSQSNGNQYV